MEKIVITSAVRTAIGNFGGSLAKVKATELGANVIKAGQSQIIVAGGTENMSQAPFLNLNARFGNRLGN